MEEVKQFCSVYIIFSAVGRFYDIHMLCFQKLERGKIRHLHLINFRFTKLHYFGWKTRENVVEIKVEFLDKISNSVRGLQGKLAWTDQILAF